MKNKITYLFFILILSLTACRDKVFETYTANSPVYLSYEDLRLSVKETGGRNLVSPGKIYFKGNYIFINEQIEGIHIYDVSDPSDPQNIGFIEIPGNIDMTIKDNILYADSYVDLVAMDISDMNSISEKARLKDVFPYQVPEYDTNYPLAEVDEEKGVVTGWELKKVTQEVKSRSYPVYCYDENFEDLYSNYTTTSASGGTVSSETSVGVGGSMARFGLYNDRLYIVDEGMMYKFNIATLTDPVEIGTQTLKGIAETMFIYNGHMFLGTTTGMLVYSLESPDNPAYVSRFIHVTSCDPVVVQNDIAYVTLRGGTACGSTSNELDVLKMTDNYSKTELLASYALNGPYGLGIDDDVLFVCDGSSGLKIYNAGDPYNIAGNQLAQFSEIKAYDVIPVNNYLFVVGENGFFLYDYNDLQNIHMVGAIPVFYAD